MSGYLPASTSLTLADSNGNIVYKGSHGCNTSTSTQITTIPSSTSTSKGHYTFYNVNDNNASVHLNLSNDKSGGHEFYHCSSTDAPKLLLTVNKVNTASQTPLLVYNNSDQRYNTNINYTQVAVRDYDISNVSTLSSQYLNLTNDSTINKICLNNVASPTITTNDTSGNESVLTASDLTINGASVAVKSDINELKIKQTNLIYQFSSQAIYADGRPPASTPSTIVNTYAINAWYFKNTTAGYKINWYIPPDLGMTVRDVLGLYLRFFNVSTTSNDNILFLTVYTKLQATNNYASWYHSSMTYVIDQTVTPTVNTNYTMFENCSGTCPTPSHYATTLVGMQPSTVNNPRGTYANTDEILAFTIGSNSASAVNSVEFVLQKFGVMTNLGTTEFAFAALL
jgi:hypothetical protein